MSQGISSRQIDTWLFRAIYAYVAILAVVTILNVDDPTERWLAIGLMLAFAVVLSRTPRFDAPEWQAVEASDDTATLTVSNDGVGPPGDLAENGFGLRGMRERAAQLGGEVRLTERAEGGTRLVFSLPLNPHADPPAGGG